MQFPGDLSAAGPSLFVVCTTQETIFRTRVAVGGDVKWIAELVELRSEAAYSGAVIKEKAVQKCSRLANSNWERLPYARCASAVERRYF